MDVAEVQPRSSFRIGGLEGSQIVDVYWRSTRRGPGRFRAQMLSRSSVGRDEKRGKEVQSAMILFEFVIMCLALEAVMIGIEVKWTRGSLWMSWKPH